jgi:methionine aminopeptidase
MGAHIDGFIAVVAHTHVVEPKEKVTGRKADVVLAAYYASEAALRLVKPGNEVSSLKVCYLYLEGNTP